MSKKAKFLAKLAEIKKEIAKLEKSFHELMEEKSGKKEKVPVVELKKNAEKKIVKKVTPKKIAKKVSKK